MRFILKQNLYRIVNHAMSNVHFQVKVCRRNMRDMMKADKNKRKIILLSEKLLSYIDIKYRTIITWSIKLLTITVETYNQNANVTNNVQYSSIELAKYFAEEVSCLGKRFLIKRINNGEDNRCNENHLNLHLLYQQYYVQTYFYAKRSMLHYGCFYTDV